MNRASRVAKWTIVSTLFALALWAGYIAHIDGARRVAQFFVWFMFVGSFVVFSSEARAKMRKKGPPLPLAIDGTFDALVTLFLVWQGAWLLAFAYTVQALLMHAAYADDDSKPKAEASHA